MIQYTVYDNTTGQIIRTGSALTEATAMLQGSAPGTSVRLVGSDPKTEIIDPGTGNNVNKLPMRQTGGALTSVNRTTCIADGLDGITISNIPTGAKYEVFLPSNLGLMQIPDGIVPDNGIYITTTVPGIYQIKLSYMNFLDFEVTFNAT